MLVLVTDVELFHHHFYCLKFRLENDTGEGEKTEASQFMKNLRGAV